MRYRARGIAVLAAATSAASVGVLVFPATASATTVRPAITSVTPAVFSPNHDGRHDTARIGFSVTRTEQITLRVLHGSTTVRTASLGTLKHGGHAWTWNGTSNRHSRAADGTYAVRIEAKIGRASAVSSTRSVRVDTAAPALTSAAGNGVTFYPTPDGYKDSFAPAITLHEAGTLALSLRTSHGTLMRSLAGYRHAGRTSITWNGRDSRNHQVAAGTYRWTFTATDAAATTAPPAATPSSCPAGIGSRTPGRRHAPGPEPRERTAPTASPAPTCSTRTTFRPAYGCSMSATVPSSTWSRPSTPSPAPSASRYGNMTVRVIGTSHYPPAHVCSSFLDATKAYGLKCIDVTRTNSGGATFTLSSVPASGHQLPTPSASASTTSTTTGPSATSTSRQ